MTTSGIDGSCAEIQAMILDAAEGTLDATRRRQLDAHVRRCPGCAADLEAVSAAWSALPGARLARPSGEVRRRILARAGRPTGAGAPGPERGTPGSFRHRAGVAAVALLATGVGIVATFGLVRRPPAGTSDGPALATHPELSVGDPVPAFGARDVSTGEWLSLEDLRGEVVLLNLWATWCLPCEREMPAMERLHRELGPLGLRIVAVSIDRESTLMVRRWVEERGITFTVLHDSEGTFERTFPSSGVPETYVIGRDGALVAHALGPQRWDAPTSTARLTDLLVGGA